MNARELKSKQSKLEGLFIRTVLTSLSSESSLFILPGNGGLKAIGKFVIFAVAKFVSTDGKSSKESLGTCLSYVMTIKHNRPH